MKEKYENRAAVAHSCTCMLRRGKKDATSRIIHLVRLDIMRKKRDKTNKQTLIYQVVINEGTRICQRPKCVP